jgi:FtsP/CotA-like multicopper oxidase with cupredoxin domain
MSRSTESIVVAALLVLGPLLIASGCDGGDPEIVDTPRDPAEPYPPTGVTREYAFKIKAVDWEVGPGAIYEAITYDGQVPGPTIDVNAGDHVKITLTNETDEPHSIHTHVVQFTNADDGTEKSLVKPGESRTYEWDAVFPGTFPYHDHADEVAIGRGLFGMLIVRAPDEEPANEHQVVLADFDPLDYKTLPGVADPVTGEFPDEGTYRGGHQYMHTINGKAYQDAVPVFESQVGELSRWRVISLGPEFHTWHIHGHRWVQADGTLTDNIALGPGMYSTFEFDEDNPGEWLVHCHVANHMEGGMMATYRVVP